MGSIWQWSNIDSHNGVAPTRQQTIIWTNDGLLYWNIHAHYNDVIMGVIASQITSLTIVYSIVYSDADQRKHQSSASLAFVRGIHRGPVNSPHKWPVMRKCFHLMTSSWYIIVQKWFPEVIGICIYADKHLICWQRINSFGVFRHTLASRLLLDLLGETSLSYEYNSYRWASARKMQLHC